MIDQEWKASQAQHLGLDDDQMELLLRIAGRGYLVAARTTYDELAWHFSARTPFECSKELKRMSAILGDDKPVPLTMRREPCVRQAFWHVRYDDQPDAFFCLAHCPSGVNAALYGGLEPCQNECVIIEEATIDQA